MRFSFIAQVVALSHSTNNILRVSVCALLPSTRDFKSQKAQGGRARIETLSPGNKNAGNLWAGKSAISGVDSARCCASAYKLDVS